MNTKSCFAPAHILLPSEQIPLEKWCRIFFAAVSAVRIPNMYCSTCNS